MKKIISIITILFATFALYSCFSVTDSLEIISIPKLEFYQNENFPLEEFVEGLKLRVNRGDIFSATTDTTSVSGFDLSQAPGVYTATVSYAAGGVSASATFMYTIRPAKETYGFADYIKVGNINTYTISNVNHFRNIVLNKDYPGYGDPTTYFILSNDLDFENTSPWIGYENEITEYRFTGTFDGNNHTIKNLHSTESIVNWFEQTATPNTTSLFLVIENASFFNITFDNCVVGNESTKGIGLLGFGLLKGFGTDGDKNGVKLIVNNVTINSNCFITGQNNAFGLVGYASYPTIKVSNYTFNGIATAYGYGAGSIASLRGTPSHIEFENCEIGGMIQASTEQSSAFFTNDFATNASISFKNCNITSTIYNLETRPAKFDFGWFMGISGSVKDKVGSLSYENCVVSGKYYVSTAHPATFANLPSEMVNAAKVTGAYTNNGSISNNVNSGNLVFADNKVTLPQVDNAKYYVVTANAPYAMYMGDTEAVAPYNGTGQISLNSWKFTEQERISKNIAQMANFKHVTDITLAGWGEDNVYNLFVRSQGLHARANFGEVTYRMIAYNSLGEPIAMYTSEKFPVTQISN